MRAFAPIFVSMLVSASTTLAGAQAPSAPSAPSVPAAPAAQDAPAVRPAPPAPPPITLGPGDPAPAFNPEKWIKGEPINGFEDGKVYVIEFWATWCGPCIAAMPHLTELQKKHPEAIFVGVAASERAPKGEDPSWRLPYVSGWVRAKGDAVMGYRVAFTPERDIPTAWMTAAGQNGIPCTFLVGKEGVIEWIGHPSQLDAPLAAVLDGSWDRSAEAERAKTARVARAKNAEAARALAQARASKDWDAAIRAYDELIAAVPMNDQARIERYQLLAGVANRPELAAKSGSELFERFKDNSMALNQLAWFIADDKSVASRDLDLALKFAERANEVADSDNPAILDTLARVWWERGERMKAIQFQQLAVREVANDETQMAKDIRATLERYQAVPATP